MTTYPPKAHKDMASWRTKGSYRRAWPLGVEPTSACECQNCGDINYVYVAFIKAGPFGGPPNLKEGQSLKWHDGSQDAGQGWYIVGRMKAYECPACMGASRWADPNPVPEFPSMRKDLL